MPKVGVPPGLVMSQSRRWRAAVMFVAMRIIVCLYFPLLRRATRRIACTGRPELLARARSFNTCRSSLVLVETLHGGSARAVRC